VDWKEVVSECGGVDNGGVSRGDGGSAERGVGKEELYGSVDGVQLRVPVCGGCSEGADTEEFSSWFVPGDRGSSTWRSPEEPVSFKFEDAMLSDLLESRGREGVFWLKWALGSASVFGDNRPSNFAFRRDIRSGIVSSFLREEVGETLIVAILPDKENFVLFRLLVLFRTFPSI
jgi:hypothetical protein